MYYMADEHQTVVLLFRNIAAGWDKFHNCGETPFRCREESPGKPQPGFLYIIAAQCKDYTQEK